jgi:hypothetical protein
LEERLEMIAELLAAAPTRSGVFGREAAAARALAESGDLVTVVQVLVEARRVGSSAADACLLQLEEGILHRDEDPNTADPAPWGPATAPADHGGFELWIESSDVA